MFPLLAIDCLEAFQIFSLQAAGGRKCKDVLRSWCGLDMKKVCWSTDYRLGLLPRGELNFIYHLNVVYQLTTTFYQLLPTFQPICFGLLSTINKIYIIKIDANHMKIYYLLKLIQIRMLQLLKDQYISYIIDFYHKRVMMTNIYEVCCCLCYSLLSICHAFYTAVWGRKCNCIYLFGS